MEATSTERRVRARLGSWPYRSDVAQLVLLDHHMVPTDRDLASWIRSARDRGVRALRTGALFPGSVQPFRDAGFQTIDELALLERPLTDDDLANRPRGTRPVRRRHLDDAATVDVRAFGSEWGNDRDALADILHATPQTRARSIVADRSLVAFAMSGVADRTGYLQRLAVDPSHRRQGAGRTLVADALGWMRTRSAARVMVNTAIDNDAALALYTSFGFERRLDTLVLLELTLDPTS